jgi:hypothetical protein
MLPRPPSCEKMPLANLYNRLCCQTGTPRVDRLSSQGSRPCDRRFARAPHRPHSRTGREVRIPQRRRWSGLLQSLGLESRSGWCRRRELCLDCNVPAQSRTPEGRPLPPSRAARSKPVPACSAETRARRNLPLTPFCHAAGALEYRAWTERVGRSDDARLREPFRSRAAEHQDSLLESSRFPEDPFRQATHHRCRFPESKAPSADGSLLASALLTPCFRKFLPSWVLEYRVPATRGSSARVAQFRINPAELLGIRQAEGRHWCVRALALSPASDTFLRAGLRPLARPAEPCRLFTGARRAACCPSTSAIE